MSTSTSKRKPDLLNLQTPGRLTGPTDPSPASTPAKSASRLSHQLGNFEQHAHLRRGDARSAAPSAVM